MNMTFLNDWSWILPCCAIGPFLVFRPDKDEHGFGELRTYAGDVESGNKRGPGISF